MGATASPLEMGHEKILYEMFTEPIAKSFLDSGSHYGYSYEKYGDKTIEELLEKKMHKIEILLDKSGNPLDIDIKKNMFRFLYENLFFDEDLEKEFQRFQQEHPDYDDFELGREFVVMLENRFKNVDSDIAPEVYSLNTYSIDTFLDGIIDFNIVTTVDDTELDIIVLRVHNGCDVRGGYSSPRVFRVDSDAFLCELTDIYIPLDSDGEKYIYSDDGYTLYNEHSDKVILSYEDERLVITPEDNLDSFVGVDINEMRKYVDIEIN